MSSTSLTCQTLRLFADERDSSKVKFKFITKKLSMVFPEICQCSKIHRFIREFPDNGKLYLIFQCLFRITAVSPWSGLGEVDIYNFVCDFPIKAVS